jgi:tetratricopeptide (TPR) repeat protein
MIRMQPEYPTAHHILGGIYAAKGMYPEALNEVHTTIKLTGGAPNGLIDLGNTYTMMGKRDETLAILNKLKTRKEYVSPFGLAILYAGLGDKENAFECLERAYAAHDSQLQYLKADTRLTSLRSDPRFTDLLRRMKMV